GADLTPKLAKLIAEYRKLESELALPRIVPGMEESGTAYEQPIFARGDCLKPGEKTPRNYVAAVLSAQGLPALNIPRGLARVWRDRPVQELSGRYELANAIASGSNPLTARVMVNRVWHHLFGTGLVRTVDDFGHVGELPSHPELLDYLAARFSSFSP